jgi:hypothetical protein
MAGKQAVMAPDLRKEIDARIRRQRQHADELRRGTRQSQRLRHIAAEQKIKRSRERLRDQVIRSKRMALRGKLKAARARERARRS